MAGRVPLLRWQENERGLFCCKPGLGKRIMVSCCKAILILFLCSLKGLEALWSGKNYGVRNLESWIQVLAWLSPLNVALDMTQPLPRPLSCLSGGENQRQPLYILGVASNKRYEMQLLVLCLGCKGPACVGSGCQSARPGSSRLWLGDKLREASSLSAWKGSWKEVA